MKKTDDDLAGDESGRFYFQTASEADALFAGNVRGNCAELEEQFGVRTVFRDLCMRILSKDPERNERVLAFLERLRQRRNETRSVLDQRDFDQILKAFSHSRENELQSFFSQRIQVSPRKKEIVPRTGNQLEYVRAIREKDIVFGIGPAGTGKTYLAMALAVSEFLAGKYDRIVLTRPAVEAGENLGFLPGKLEEKINPYLRPLYDALYDMLDAEEASSLLERGIIEVAPLAFMRGRTLNNSFIILDEAQNATNEQMLMFLTRLGFRSKCVVAGDPSQVDLPVRHGSGLMHAVHTLKKIDEIAVCRFTSGDVVRHSLVEKIVNAYKEKSREPENKIENA